MMQKPFTRWQLTPRRRGIYVSNDYHDWRFLEAMFKREDRRVLRNTRLRKRLRRYMKWRGRIEHLRQESQFGIYIFMSLPNYNSYALWSRWHFARVEESKNRRILLR